ncbi:uncharacterized protein [Amphiura filiformis]|uniref:uncharacterized protein isoform X1 n=1 Tax=Amphiura filiformis TaxID=82378 RepID=UPI003B214C09
MAAQRGRTWEEPEVLILIDIFWGERIQSLVDNTVRNKNVYKKCVILLEAQGYERTHVEIRTKINNLKSFYRRQPGRVGNPGPSGSGRQGRSAIFMKLDEYLSEKPSTKPTVVLESSNDPLDTFVRNACKRGHVDRLIEMYAGKMAKRGRVTTKSQLSASDKKEIAEFVDYVDDNRDEALMHMYNIVRNMPSQTGPLFKTKVLEYECSADVIMHMCQHLLKEYEADQDVDDDDDDDDDDLTQLQGDSQLDQALSPSAVEVVESSADEEEESQSILALHVTNQDSNDSDNSVDEDVEDEDKPATFGQKSKDCGQKKTPNSIDEDDDDTDTPQDRNKPSTSGQKRKTASKSGTKQSTRRKKSKYDKALSSMQDQYQVMNEDGSKKFQEMLLEQMKMQQEWEERQREKDKEDRKQFQQELMQAERATLLDFGNMLKGLFQPQQQQPLSSPFHQHAQTYAMHRPDMATQRQYSASPELFTPRRFTPSPPEPRRISPDSNMSFGSTLSEADASLQFQGL